ncbi:MAG: ribosome biogenesis GTPase Der [Actinomycetota bacterium]
MSRLPVVAVVGRANVGKSTLINRILGRREAIEHPEPGVTRDRRGYAANWAGAEFTLIDTGGWEPRARGLTAKVRAQAERAAREADLILVVVDARTGITEDDLAVARGLRGTMTPIIVVANKVDTREIEDEVPGFDRLALGPAFPVSALHGRGSGDLLDVVVERISEVDSTAPDSEGDALAVALVGRPNVGKSSLFNQLVGDERSIVHDLPGTTRDAVDTVAEIGGKRYRFIDTAGMRRRVKDAKGPEYYGLVRSLRAIDEADIAIQVVDVDEGVTEQDQKIANVISEAGCGAVVVLNKWDHVAGEDADSVADDVRDALRFLSWAPIVRTSALTGRGIAKIAPAVEIVRASWEQRVATAELNAWLREGIEGLALGTTERGRPVRIRYITQARTRPPQFVIFASGRLTAGATRAVERRLRGRFGFEGTPIRIATRTPQPRL